MSLYLRLLGGARIEVDGAPVTGRAAHRRRIGLLALLVCAPNNRLSRERIVEYLWPESDSDNGRRVLSEALHVIRRELGASTILTIGDEVAIDAAIVQSDVADFRTAADAGDDLRAIALYAGPLLDGWFVSKAHSFDEWASNERQRLHAQFVGVLERRASALELVSDWRSAAEVWQRLVELERECARYVICAATALRASGERAAALRALSAFTSYMKAEGLPVERAVHALELELTQNEVDESLPATRSTEPKGTVRVELVHDGNPTRPVESELPSTGSPSTSAGAGEPLTKPVGRPPFGHARSYAAVLAAIVVLVASGWVAMRASKPEPPDSMGAGVVDPNRVAVLYFNSSGRESRYLAEALTEQLVSELDQVPALKVVPLGGVRPYRDAGEDRLRVSTPRPSLPSIDSIARLLHAGTAVEGFVQRDGDRIRVTIDLVDARTGTTIGGRQTVEHQFGGQSIFALEDDVAQHVAVILRQRLGRSVQLRASRTGTTSPAAQDLFLRGRGEQRRADELRAMAGDSARLESLRALRAADSLFARAAQIDREWQEPRIERGWIALSRALVDTANSDRWFASGFSYVGPVLIDDSTNARALALRGTLLWRQAARTVHDSGAFRRERDRAAADLRRAIALDSTQALTAITLSQLLRATSHSRADLIEAVTLARIAYERDAYLAYASDVISMLYRATARLGQTDSAAAWCNRGRAIAPEDWKFVECELSMMRYHFATASVARAWQLVDTLTKMSPALSAGVPPSPYTPIYRRLIAATVSAVRGDGARASLELTRARAAAGMSSEVRTDMMHEETFLWLALGRRDSAFATLRAYLEVHPEFTGYVLNDLSFRQFGLDSSSVAQGIRRADSRRSTVSPQPPSR